MGNLKITRTLLDDYEKNQNRIAALEYEISEMRREDKGIGSSIINDYRTGYPRPQAVTGFDWELYERRKKALRRAKDKVKAVKDWIESIEDDRTRAVFKMYYIDGMTWTKIAHRFGMPGESTPRVCIRDEYLKQKKIV